MAVGSRKALSMARRNPSGYVGNRAALSKYPQDRSIKRSFLDQRKIY